MRTLKQALKSASTNAKRGPVWEGPSGRGLNGGVTQGLLGRYLTCRERFRIYAMEGLRPADAFNSRVEYGNMWHVCEEEHAKPGSFKGHKYGAPAWKEELARYCRTLCSKYRLQQPEINDWYEKCKAQFPLYVKHWSEHPDVKERTPLLQEQVFDVPYQLPSSRIVRLRGKWDSVDLIRAVHPADTKSTRDQGGIWLQENKTKSAIDGERVARQLAFDLQTMLYLVALESWWDDEKQRSKARAPDAWVRKEGILGVRYNVIKRSAHKSAESMVKKIEEDRAAGRIGEWFARWNVMVSPADVARFRRECLDPVLENLADDYEWWADGKPVGINCGYDLFSYDVRSETFPHHQSRHFRMPFGIYNPLIEGGSSDLDAYLESGSEVGLHRVENLFEELR